MLKNYYICWVDDRPKSLESLNDHIELVQTDFSITFHIDIHKDTNDFDVIARNIDDDLIFFVDFNLKDNEGNGLDGHEVISLIRKNNKNCKIVFYSSKATQQELRQLVKNHEFVICVLREDLSRVLTEIGDGSFFS